MKAWWNKLFGEKQVELVEPPHMTFGRIQKEMALEYSTGKIHEKMYISIMDFAGLVTDSESLRRFKVLEEDGDEIEYNKALVIGSESMFYYTLCGQLEIIPAAEIENGQFKWDEPKRYRSIIMGACKFCGTDPGNGDLCQNCGASTAWN